MPTLRETIEHDLSKSKKRKWPKWIAVGVVLIILMVGIYFAVSSAGKMLSSLSPVSPGKTTSSPAESVENPPSSPSELPVENMVFNAISAMEDGNYAGALLQAEEGKQKCPDDPEFKKFYSDFNELLKVTLEFHHLRRGDNQNTDTLVPILTRQNPYWLSLKVFKPCYLYIIQHHSSGYIKVLFPNSKYSSLTLPVQSGVIRLPDLSRQSKFEVDTAPGEETIYLMASYWQQKKLENLLSQASGPEKTDNRQSVVDEILTIMKNADEYTAKIPSLAYCSYTFKNESVVEKFQLNCKASPEQIDKGAI